MAVILILNYIQYFSSMLMLLSMRYQVRSLRIQLTSAIPTQTNTQRHIEYTTSNNHGFSVGTKVNIHGCTPDYFNARLLSKASLLRTVS